MASLSGASRIHVKSITAESSATCDNPRPSIRPIHTLRNSNNDPLVPETLEPDSWRPSRKIVPNFIEIQNKAREVMTPPKKHTGPVIVPDAAGVTTKQISREPRRATKYVHPSLEQEFKPHKRQHVQTSRDPLLEGELLPSKPRGLRTNPTYGKAVAVTYDVFPHKALHSGPPKGRPAARVSEEEKFRPHLRRPEGLEKFAAVQDHTRDIYHSGPVERSAPTVAPEVTAQLRQTVGETRQMYELYKARNTRLGNGRNFF
ncbi:hypothetical protein J8273_0994 [Carpediemonas membranifera]|uniref:Uncharacterized protein n=1 Tax=Carpediemonas membranifera TaxID=201153 RepID=A0A8J6C101_9EUKA|nr:hypothetical protein J8273_0994 [Carpediemonas membranifera]|eukprot:KAG9397086.1 hypothetical protein J8273_0994 [Carpediemonas membranifera]